MTVLYESWNEANGKWKDSKIYLQAKTKASNRKTGRRMWLTRAEMVIKFGEQGAAAIIERKLADPELLRSQVRRHPEAPDEPSLTQYLCLDMDSESYEEEEVVTKLFKAVDAGGDDDSGQDDESSNSSSSSSTRSASSSSSKKKKEKRKNKTKEDRTLIFHI